MNDLYIIIVIIVVVIGAILKFYYEDKMFHKSTYWKNGIPDLKKQEELLSNKFDPNKGILYIPRRMVGIWLSENQILDNNLDEENIHVMEVLSRNYNLILYISKTDYYGNHVTNIDASIKYIEEHHLPICFIANQLPARDVLDSLKFNSGTYWLCRYIGKI